VRVSDDHTASSRFLPKISLDAASGDVAVAWYDSRNDLGTGGLGGTDGPPATPPGAGGVRHQRRNKLHPNIQISAGISSSDDSGNGIDYGDYTGLPSYGAIAHPAWSGNSTSTGNNPDGAWHQLDIYTAAVPVPWQPGSGRQSRAVKQPPGPAHGRCRTRGRTRRRCPAAGGLRGVTDAGLGGVSLSRVSSRDGRALSRGRRLCGRPVRAAGLVRVPGTGPAREARDDQGRDRDRCGPGGGGAGA
jgi:hypothetical protein